MKDRCDDCGDWLEYTDTDNGYDFYVCINCGREYKFKLIQTKNGFDYATK